MAVARGWIGVGRAAALDRRVGPVGDGDRRLALGYHGERDAIGATSIKQLDDNLAALDFDIPAELSARLDEAGRPEAIFPYLFFGPRLQSMISGGVAVRREPPWYRG